MYSFDRVIPSENQIKDLYTMLNSRQYNISHCETSYNKHIDFVKNNPYRDWFIISFNNDFIGNFYLQNDNSIGVNLCVECDSDILTRIISFVKNNFQPLDGIPSTRYEGFFINVAFNNSKMINILSDLGYDASQISFPLASRPSL